MQCDYLQLWAINTACQSSLLWLCLLMEIIHMTQSYNCNVLSQLKSVKICAHHEGCKMKAEISKIQGPRRRPGYWFGGEKRRQHIITSHGLHFHTLAFILRPTRLEIVLSPEFMLLFATPSLYCSIHSGAVLHSADLKWRRKESNQKETCFTWVTVFLYECKWLLQEELGVIFNERQPSFVMIHS